MSRNHKHKGVLTSVGALRSHPIERAHKDLKVQKHHDKEIADYTGASKKVTKKAVPKSKPRARPTKEKFVSAKIERSVMCPVDAEGYMYIDLMDSSKQVKGVRLKFQRQEGRTKKTVGLQIEK